MKEVVDVKDLALEIKATFDLLSPFIEKHTLVVCPDCKKVCCADRHGLYDDDDLSFLNALGEESCQESGSFNKNDSCRYIYETGCSLERWRRPYRCTFFFCDALLKSIESDDPKLYRAFMSYFQHLVYLRQKLIEDKELEPENV